MISCDCVSRRIFIQLIMKRLSYYIALLFMASLQWGYAQQQLTLQQCLDIGLKNSLDFQLKQLDVLTAETTYRKPLMEYLPTASISGSHNYNIGSVIDPATNSRISSNIQTDNLSLNANINLLDFNIFTKSRRDKIALLKAKADKEATIAEYSISVLDNYINAFYTQELLKIQQTQFENAKFNLNRITNEVTIGSRPKSDLYDMQVSYALEESNLLQTSQLLYNQKLMLLQLLNAESLSPDVVNLTGFDSPIKNEVADVNQITIDALKAYPTVKAANLSVSVAKKEVKMQRNYYLPVISGYYSYSSFYYLPVNGNQSVNPFWTQLSDNKNHYVGAQVSIPLFNGLKTHRDVQLAKVNVQKREVELKQEELKLRQSIEQETAKQQQNNVLADTMLQTRNHAEKSLETTQAKFSSGLVDAIVFSTAKNQLLTAEYNLLKARVSAIHAHLKLKYYQSGNFGM